MPYASIYRGLAIMGTQGFGALPKHCSYFMTAFFFGAIAVNALRDAVGLRWPRVAALIPVPMVSHSRPWQMRRLLPACTNGIFHEARSQLNTSSAKHINLYSRHSSRLFAF